MKDLYHPFLVGEIIYLRGLEEQDLVGSYFQWFNDQESDVFTNHAVWPNSQKKMRAFFDKVADGRSDLVLAIIDKASHRHIGNIGLHDINWQHRHAKLAIIVGEKDMRGGGRGAEAVRLVTGHAFKRLNLHRIHLGVREDNTPARRAYAKAGFQEEGCLRDVFLSGGTYYNVINMSLISPY
ncbi:MAG: GNAT family N-acetyltransferase [Magnetococcales bacterium]|nr:GNAT family N-acetyltransferase [Magnetococcales bacterium]MBF0148976.1 GNAT family N-acetyltransferase [Magnetococcales bacterium]MBF0603042.1 GNAT family N-acetyltransferase [Magnetococcales bacterium]